MFHRVLLLSNMYFMNIVEYMLKIMKSTLYSEVMIKNIKIMFYDPHLDLKNYVTKFGYVLNEKSLSY